MRLALTSGDQLPAEWAREVVARGERMTPALCNVLLKEENWHRGDAGWCAVNHAAYLLGAIAGENSVAPLVHALRQAAELDNDWISEEIPSILGSVGPQALPFLKELALDREADWYLRERALAGMAAVTLRSPEHAREVFSFISEICADETDDPEARSWAGGILLDFSLREHEPLLLTLAASGASEGHFDAKDVRRAWDKPDLSCYQRRWLDFYDPESLASRRRRWENGRLSLDRALQEVSRVPWGTDPDDGPGEEGPEDEAAPFSLKGKHMLAEKASFRTSRLIREKDFKSLEEANDFLRGLEGAIPPASPAGPWEEAQELMFDAWDAEDPRERVKLARRALELSPDCADAYNLLAEETARTLDAALDLYRQALRAGERQLGAAFFAENVGHFWGMVESRPYMRARAELARCLWLSGEKDEALAHWRDMLLLNPRDNQGMRYVLAASLSRLGRFEELETLLDRDEYKGDSGLEWLTLRALSAFATRGRDDAGDGLLRAALERNAAWPGYVLGDKALPRNLPDHYAVGSDDEAVICADAVAPAWRAVPGALPWLESVMGRAPRVTAGRNESCPCGSGKKFKKCCLNGPVAGHA